MIKIVFGIILLIYLLLTYYVGIAFKLLLGKIGLISFYIVSLLVAITFFIVLLVNYSSEWTHFKGYVLGVFLTLTAFLLVVSVFLFLGNGFNFIVNLFAKKEPNTIVSRRKFVAILGLGLASIPFVSMIYGMVKGKYNFRVIEHTLFFDNLPKGFDGYQITHISDIHSGSFDNYAKIEYAIDLINEQKSDVIFFTGDMVNNKAEEMNPWKDLFAKLKARDGLFSVLGNHDYGDYVRWKSKQAKQDNLEQLKKIQKDIGFNLLLNENRSIKKGNEQISILGVENWGKGFSCHGDLDKALKGVDKKDFKILLSHDPTHWQEKVLKHQQHIDLTLSGHTHGMQFGIEIPGWIKWSPAQFRYQYWAGIYNKAKRYINVNRGFGFLAFPGRVGIWPEITVIKLKKK